MKPTADQIDAARVPSINGESFSVFLRFENEAELVRANTAYFQRRPKIRFGIRERLISKPDGPCLLMLTALEDAKEGFIADLLEDWPDNCELQTLKQAMSTLKPTADQIDAAFLLSHDGRSLCVFLRFENEAELLRAEEAYYERNLSDPFGSRARLISAPDAPCLLVLSAAQSERQRFIDHLVETWPDNCELQTWEQAKPLWDAWGARVDAERETRETERKTAALKAATTPKGVSVETPAPGETPAPVEALAPVEAPVSVETLGPINIEAVRAWHKQRPAFASREINTMTNEWREPLTEEQLVEYRAWMIELDGDRKFTCDGCNARHRCSLAFDEWNVDGDCLASK